MIKVNEWKAIQLKLDSIDTGSKKGYHKWKEIIERLEGISQKHKIKPAKSIYEDIDRLG
jgi:hypothetical protein